MAEAPAPRGRNWEAVLVESREARRKAFMVVRVEDSVAKGPASACTGTTAVGANADDITLGTPDTDSGQAASASLEMIFTPSPNQCMFSASILF